MIVAAIPVHNEEAHIGTLLTALAQQSGVPPFEVVLLLNNCCDRTAAVVTALAPSLPYRIHLHEHMLQGADANAGTARRMAMERAAALAGPADILLTTDADATPDMRWVAANLAALSAGADAVAGRAVIDAADEAALPASMVADEARVQLLATLLDRIDCLIFPEPHDPWPRHGEHSGASIAVTVDAYRRVGGMPALPIGEDRAFFEAMRRVDARIRHAPDVFVTVSGRLFGRAKGGMAETMRRRMRQPDAWLDDPIEPAGDRLRRARTRRQLHAAWRSGMPDAAVVTLSASLGLAPRCLRDLVDVTYFGEAWHRVVSASEPLRRRHVAAEARELEIALACDVLATLENTPAEMVGSTDGMSSRAAMTGGG